MDGCTIYAKNELNFRGGNGGALCHIDDNDVMNGGASRLISVGNPELVTQSLFSSQIAPSVSMAFSYVHLPLHKGSKVI